MGTCDYVNGSLFAFLFSLTPNDIFGFGTSFIVANLRGHPKYVHVSVFLG